MIRYYYYNQSAETPFLSRLDLGIAKEMLAMRAIEEKSHIGRDSSRLILIKHSANNRFIQPYETGYRRIRRTHS